MVNTVSPTPAKLHVSSATATAVPPRARSVEAVATLTTVPRGVLDGGEIILLAIKPSMWRPVFDSLGWLVLCCVAAAVALSSGMAFPGVSAAATAQLILLLGLARLGLGIGRWIPTWYILTNRRVLSVHGVRVPKLATCALTDIENVRMHTTVLERMVRAGSMTISARNDPQASQFWHSVPRPHFVYDQLQRAIREAANLQGRQS